MAPCDHNNSPARCTYTCKLIHKLPARQEGAVAYTAALELAMMYFDQTRSPN